MDVVVLSGSRADQAPLKVVADALKTEVTFLPRRPENVGADSAWATSEAIQATVKIFQNRHLPDFAVILGDRHEILGAATALNLMNIPIAHLSGGDITEGSQDDSVRHAITKLSHIHFVTNQGSQYRVMCMGEESWRVLNVGCPSIDKVKNTTLFTQDEVCKRLGIQAPFILVAYQPATLADDPVGEAQVLLDYLSIAGKPCVFSTLNADPDSETIQEMFTRFAVKRGDIIFDMPQQLYLSVMKHCDFMIGNSSSGFYEAPTLRTPFVNIGERQKGRHAPGNIVTCAAKVESIIKAVKYAKLAPVDKVVNPYGDGNSGERIVRCLDMFNRIHRKELLNKKWVQHDGKPSMGTGSQGSRLGCLPE